MITNKTYEPIGGGIQVCVTPEHTFGTDAFLLSYFANPKRKDTVCDLGTGCGIIPLLWYRTPEQAPNEVIAVDIQPKAIAQLKDTLKHSSTLAGFIPLQADIREIHKILPAGQFDLVTSNPPYNLLQAGKLSKHTADQIARHESLCTIHDICHAASWLLRFGGRLCICQLPERLTDVFAAMRDHNIEPKRLRMVQQTVSDAPWLVLVEGKRGSKSSLFIEPPLLMKTEGKMTQELSAIYGMYGRVEE